MNDRGKCLHIFTSDATCFPNIFDLKVVGSMDTEPSYMEWLTIQIHICVLTLLSLP
jgi:hypothetical protein